MYTNHSLGTVPGQHFSQDWLSDGTALSHARAPGSHLAVEDSVSQGWHYQLQIEFVSFQFKIFRITVGSTKAQSLLLIYLYLQFKIERRHAQGFRARLSVMRLLLTHLLLFNIKLLLFVLWVYDKTIIFMKSNVVVSAQKVFSYRYWEISISQISVTALKQLIMDPYLTILWQNNAYQISLWIYLQLKELLKIIQFSTMLLWACSGRAPKYNCRPLTYAKAKRMSPLPSNHKTLQPASVPDLSPAKSVWRNDTKGSTGGGCIYICEPCASSLKHALGL